MATPGQLWGTVADVTGTNGATVENIYNHLRNDGEIPKGGRGLNALRVTSEAAAKLLIAVCCAEHVKDAPDAVRRYAPLEGKGGYRDDQGESGAPFTGYNWQSLAPDFPRLAELPSGHSFLDAFVALIDSFIDEPSRDGFVKITFGSPRPWSKASVTLQNGGPSRRVAIVYTTPEVHDDEGRSDDDPEFLALIDPSKERQRRRFAKLGGDLSLTMEITNRTLSALGDLLRNDAQ